MNCQRDLLNKSQLDAEVRIRMAARWKVRLARVALHRGIQQSDFARRTLEKAIEEIEREIEETHHGNGFVPVDCKLTIRGRTGRPNG